jgi:hypothetical protein
MTKGIKPCIIVLLAVVLSTLPGCQNSQHADPIDAEGFTVLFDGKDLSKWSKETGYWRVEDGAVVLKNKGDQIRPRTRNSGYLWTRQTYGDFVLELDYKLPYGPVYGSKGKGANSGVFIRVEDKAEPVQTGIEIQITNAEPNVQPGRGTVGGIYDLMPPKHNMHKLDEWNHCRITCEGSVITVELNGKETASADLNEWTTARKNPDGTSNKFQRPLKDFARRGYIGLQDHGTPASFRNIRIKVLDR